MTKIEREPRMAHVDRPDPNERSSFEPFVILGRVDTAILLLALGAFAAADFSEAGTALRGALVALALAAVAIGVALNGIRRANSIRRHRSAIARSKARLEEFDRLDAADDDL